MKSIRAEATALALAAAMVFSGCSMSSGNGDIDMLLRAPQLSGQASAVQRALNTFLGEVATLKYPANGDFLSPLLFGDWDGDGTDEAAVLYTADSIGPTVWLAVLEPASDNTWKVSKTIQGLSADVESVTYAKLRDADSQQILVGYDNTQGDRYLAVYLYRDGTLQTVIQQAYTEMLLANVTGVGDTQDLILALPTETENGGMNLQLLTSWDGLFRSTQTLSLGADNFSGCAALSAGISSDGTHYLVADGYTGGSSRAIASMLIDYNAETGYLEAYQPAGTAGLSRITLRYDTTLLSADIDGNDTVDIPTEVDDGGTLSAPLDKRLHFLLWKDYTDIGGGNTHFGVYDTAYRFFLPLPESMHGSVLLRQNAAGNGWYVCNADGSVQYCELRVVDQSQVQSAEYQRVASVGSQQLQARVLTPYYGLSLQQIVNGLVVLDSDP